MSWKYLLAATFLLLLLSQNTLEAKPFSKTVSFFKESTWQFFPVPIFKTLPAEGQTYGIMPVLVGSGGDYSVKTIIALAETWNQITGPSTFTTSYIYPSPADTVFFFGEIARHFAREGTVRYTHTRKEKGAWNWEGLFSTLQYPFERFFGFGPKTSSGNETNFLSETFTGHGEIGYFFTSSLLTSYRFRVEDWQLHPKALPTVADTLTTFPADPEVVPSTNLTHRIEIRYDTHSDPVFPEKGEKFSLAYLTSLRPLGSDFNFRGYDLQAKLTYPILGERFTTVVLGQLEQRFGSTIPFYLQSSLGGSRSLRAFTERRYTARHRFNFELEERIEVLRRRIAKTEVALSLDPFLSVGQVFNHFSEINGSDLRLVGGFGIRMKAKPSVVGRLDIGFGREGMQVYATVDYPF